MILFHWLFGGINHVLVSIPSWIDWLAWVLCLGMGPAFCSQMCTFFGGQNLRALGPSVPQCPMVFQGFSGVQAAISRLCHFRMLQINHFIQFTLMSPNTVHAKSLSHWLLDQWGPPRMFCNLHSESVVSNGHLTFLFFWKGHHGFWWTAGTNTT